MKIALVQMNSTDDKGQNIHRALALCSRAFSRGAQFVLLPEYFYFRGRIKGVAGMREVTEPVDGPTTRMFAAMAQKARGHILLGSIYERSPDPRKAYDTAVLLSPSGKVVGTYRKQHLFHLRLPGQEIRETDTFLPGGRRTVVRVGNFRVGLTICFDLRFPDIFERSVQQGADLFVVPSSFAYATGKAHWEILLRARAIETFSYVLAPNQTGRSAEGARCWGHSMAVDPWGKVLAQASADREEIVYARIDTARVHESRQQFPGYKNR